eukprot:g18906.t1
MPTVTTTATSTPDQDAVPASRAGAKCTSGQPRPIRIAELLGSQVHPVGMEKGPSDFEVDYLAPKKVLPSVGSVLHGRPEPQEADGAGETPGCVSTSTTRTTGRGELPPLIHVRQVTAARPTSDDS